MDLRNLDGLRKESQEGARMAYSGKQIIHPNQVNPVQEAYTPSDEAIAHARRVVEADAQHQARGQRRFHAGWQDGGCAGGQSRPASAGTRQRRKR
jgi:citrate lyase subunit beta-like protein